MTDLRNRLLTALGGEGAGSSDFDLNPDVVLPEGRKLRDAGVLIAIKPGAEPSVLLTKRASGLKHHPGQIAFPGGKVDPTDTDVVAAALREASEEVGLSPDNVDILGCLPSHETVTGFTVTPVLAFIRDDFDPAPELGEVEEAFSVPLGHVLDTTKYAVEYRRWRGQRRYYFIVPYGPYYIWGATARILRALAERMQA